MSQAGRHRAPARHAKPKKRTPKKWVVPAFAGVMAMAVAFSTITHQSHQKPSAAPDVNPTALHIEAQADFGASTFEQSKAVVTKPVPTKFKIKVVKDPNLAAGVKKVVTPGRNGAAVVRYLVSRVNGKEVSRSIISRKVIAAPRTQVVVQGTGNPKKTLIALQTAAAQADSPTGAKEFARLYIAAKYGWSTDQFACLVTLWTRESNWRVAAGNSAGAYGIPQALPGTKMASFGDDWKTSAATQIKWGTDYIDRRYGAPCSALSHSYASNWY